MKKSKYILKGIWFLPEELKVVLFVYRRSTEKSLIRFCGKII